MSGTVAVAVRFATRDGAVVLTAREPDAAGWLVRAYVAGPLPLLWWATAADGDLLPLAVETGRGPWAPVTLRAGGRPAVVGVAFPGEAFEVEV